VRQRTGPVTCGKSGWPGSGRLAEGDGVAQCLQLADVVAGLAVGVGAAGVVPGAQLAEARGGGSLFLANGRECKVITGIDDHSRFCVIAAVVMRATARAVCLAFTAAMTE
jgi:hypothetical protein